MKIKSTRHREGDQRRAAERKELGMGRIEDIKPPKNRNWTA